MKHLISSLFLFLLFLNAQAQLEYDPFADSPAPEKEKISLVTANSTIAPGEPFDVFIQITHKPDWHSYYVNPGAVGSALDLDWELPEGFKTADIQWATPHLNTKGLTPGYQYSHTTWHKVTITPPADLEIGKEFTLSADAQWQVCKEQCSMNFGSPSLTVTSAKKSSVTADTDTLSKARNAQPIRDSSAWQVKAYKQGGQFLLDITPSDANTTAPDHIYFFSSDKQSDMDGKQELEKTDDGYRLTVTAAKEAKSLAHLSGVLYSESGWLKGDPRTGFEFNELPIEKKPLESASVATLFGILGGMLLGGLILNLMPCVFPVIGLKIMGFAQQAGEDRKKVVLHGITFAAGVLVSFWVLAGLLLSLRNKALAGAGEDVGWGYQLQNPYIVLSILLLMFILALNMFGVFEIGTSATGVGGKLQSKQGLQGSFFSGVLATIVATPCSAPFLGAAIGAAFALPNVQFMLAFTAMALGLALPYLILSVFPHLIEKLPRPGPWMESFKQAMSFLLFATAGYLLWVYVAQTGLDFMFNIIIGLSLIAIAVWIYGRWNLPHRTTKVRTIAKVLTLLALAGGVFAILPPDKSKQLEWGKWSETKVEELLEEGTPVYVDFTATWCATCQVNKKNAYPPEIVDLFKEYGVVALKADKTSPSPDIDKKLQQLGRTAIPVNVLYVPGKDEPIITPELLSADYIRELITSNLEKPTEEEG